MHKNLKRQIQTKGEEEILTEDLAAEAVLAEQYRNQVHLEATTTKQQKANEQEVVALENAFDQVRGKSRSIINTQGSSPSAARTTADPSGIEATAHFCIDPRPHSRAVATVSSKLLTRTLFNVRCYAASGTPTQSCRTTELLMASARG